jgi:hypothetical protein
MTIHIDVCNGDADGLCAVVQWRLHEPAVSQLVTGLKRDIELLAQVQATQGTELLVCDLSMQRNRQPLLKLLEVGVFVRYFDHHQVDQVPTHPLLEAHIDLARDICTSLLVDRYLKGRFRAWALVGAYGDNMRGVAEDLGVRMGLAFEDRRRLQALGEAINYNAYGDSLQDVYMPPALLFERLARYADPLEFLKQEPIGQELETLRNGDLQRARSLPPYMQSTSVGVYLLPDTPWARRVVGSLGNDLACANPSRAHAVLKTNASGDFTVSVRAPVSRVGGAAAFCRNFGGDGRAAAAGIDHLPADQLDRFTAAFSAYDWGDASVVLHH